MKKRIVSIVMILCMVSALMSVLTAPAAAADYLRNDNYVYEIIGGRVKILLANPEMSGPITIPSAIDGYPVTEIGDVAFFECENITQITIPRSVTKLGLAPWYGCLSLSAFYVDAANPNYCAVDGVLFNKSKTALIAYPTNNIRGWYTVPYTVTRIEAGAFAFCERITNIGLYDSVKYIGIEAFDRCWFLKDVRYTGSEYQWSRIVIEQGNEFLEEANIHYNVRLLVDVPSSKWYAKAVNFVLNRGLFTGIDSAHFDPDGNMTRAMYVTVLGRLAGAKVNHKQETQFSDVPVKQWYTGYVRWAANAGIVNGVSKTKFAPNADITREQICKMMVEYCSYANIKLKKINKAKTFKDEQDISKWAKEYVAKAQTAGFVNGDQKGRFNPTASATRAEVATIFMNFDKNYNK